MNKLFSLTKIQVKDFLGKSTNSLGVKNKLLGRMLLLLMAGLLAVPASTLSVITYKSFATINQTELLITSLYLNSVIFMFVFGIPFIVSVFFFSKDSRFLSALPIPEDNLVLSKLATVYIYLLAISSLILGPGLVVYTINTGVSFLLIILVLLTLIMAPLLPLLISSIVILPFGNIFSRSSRRKTLILIFNVFMLVAIIAVQLFFGRYMEDPSKIQEIILDGNLLELLGSSFPPSIWLTRMYLGSFLDAVLFIGLNIVLFFLLKSLARLFFRKSIHSFAQEGSIRVGDIYYKKKSLALQLIKRNMFIILKEPMFLLNTGLSLIVPLLVFVMMLFTGEFSMDILGSAQIEPYLLLILSGILISPAVIANVSATAITREGQSFWETRVLPISAVNNLKYRIVTTIILNLSASLLLLLVSVFILPITVKMVILAGIFCITGTLFLATIDIVVNIYRPLLNWTNPTAAVKNNLNVIYSMLIRAVIAGTVYLVYIAIPGFFVNYEITLILASLVSIGLYFLARSFVYTRGAEKFNSISI